MYKVYILYSVLRDRYYIGCTGDEMDERLRRHNSNHKGFSGSVNDWVLKYQEMHLSKSKALLREKEIKNWKSRVLLQKLIDSRHPD